jgi:hypothetical protein
MESNIRPEKINQMEIKNIEILLKDFYEGNTSLEQEKKLLSFFESDEVPDSLQKEKILFLSCYKTEESVVPVSLKDKLESLIDNEAQKSEKRRFKGRSVRVNWLRYSAVAAGLLLLITIGLNTYETEISNIYTDTYSNPYDAYRETQKALTMVSKNLNKGYTEVENASIEIGKAQDILNEQLNKVSKIK